MPAPPLALAPVPGGLWVAAGTRVELLDPSSGSVRLRVPLPGRAQLMVADPSRTRLYVTTDTPIRRDKAPLLELDAETGATIARSWQGFADLQGPSGLTATDHGVWLVQPTGMTASVRFLRSSDLHQAGIFRPGGANSLTAYVAGGVLWITDVSGGNVCVDAATGRVLGHLRLKGASAGTSNVVEVPRVST